MIEKLIPLDLPAGFVNNGTTYQSKNRWFTGSLVRFFQKTIQPIGGWVQRSLSGASITGTPNAAVSWKDNSGNAWLAIGTTTKLFVVSSANAVTDITPTTNFNTGGNAINWQLDVFGTYLLAVYNNGAGGLVNAFYWTGSGVAVPVQSGVLLAPYNFYGVVATPERFMMLLQGSDEDQLSGGFPLSQSNRASLAGAVATALVN